MSVRGVMAVKAALMASVMATAGAAWGAETVIPSKITAVTVYPAGATVTRVATVTVDGQTFTCRAAAPGATEFLLGGSKEATLDNLRTAFNALPHPTVTALARVGSSMVFEANAVGAVAAARIERAGLATAIGAGAVRAGACVIVGSRRFELELG